MNDLRNSKSDDQLEQLLLLTEQMKAELDQKDRTIRKPTVQRDESQTLSEKINREYRALNNQFIKSENTGFTIPSLIGAKCYPASTTQPAMVSVKVAIVSKNTTKSEIKIFNHIN